MTCAPFSEVLAHALHAGESLAGVTLEYPPPERFLMAADDVLATSEMQSIKDALRAKYQIFRHGWVFDHGSAASDLPASVVAWLEDEISPLTGGVIDEGADELARLRRREQQWAADVVWRANWMTRAINVLGEIREQLEHELTETGHLATIEQLLADELEDEAGDE